MPTASSPVSAAASLSISSAICTSTEPPPAITPSCAAARAALIASSTRSLRSLTSVSVAPPTRSTATPPESFARRSSSFSRSQFESVFSMSRRSWVRRSATASWEPPPSTMTVSSFVTVMRRAEPMSSRVTADSFPPSSLSTTVAPVTMARSSMNALRRSPKYGDFTPTTFRDLRMELTTSICRGSPSMSSAMISTSLPDWAICSRTGRKSGRLEIFSRTSRTSGFSRTA